MTTITRYYSAKRQSATRDHIRLSDEVQQECTKMWKELSDGYYVLLRKNGTEVADESAEAMMRLLSKTQTIALYKWLTWHAPASDSAFDSGLSLALEAAYLRTRVAGAADDTEIMAQRRNGRRLT